MAATTRRWRFIITSCCIVAALAFSVTIAIQSGYRSWKAPKVNSKRRNAAVLNTPSQIGQQTCKRCYSVRDNYSGRWLVSYESSQFEGCNHIWDDGLPFGVGAIHDGRIILVYQEGQFGAFIPTNQTQTSMDYRWYYRPDGEGTLDPNDSSVLTGTGRINVPSGESGGHVIFGPFSMYWSEGEPNAGWLYYNCFAGGPAGSGDVRICLTDETDITNLDASDPKWLYAAFPGDEPLPIDPSMPANKNIHRSDGPGAK